MATLPKTDALAYTDFSGLSKLRRGAGQNDPAAIRAVAEQFEALLTRTMLKSMRDAVGRDPMFGSDQQDMYQGLADDQLSIQLSKGRGFGLADMLVRQLQKLGVKGAESALGAGTSNGAAGASSGTTVAGARAAAAYSATQRTTAAGPMPAATEAAKTSFIQEMWPHAEQAGQLLGIDPRHLVAQAALETNWGRNMPQDSAGRCSNNLFGIKSSSDWTGPTASNATQEFSDGLSATTSAQFKVYATPAQSFQDYASLLRNNPRYASALNTGSDVKAFANGLQRGGYATDPDYAGKIAAVAGKVGHAVAAAAGAGFKAAAASLMPFGSGSLLRNDE